MKLALIFPPSCDPTSPYISIPLLTGFLRSRKVEVLPVDANVEAYRYLLQPDRLSGFLSEARRRFRKLDMKPGLSHEEQLEYTALYHAVAESSCVPERIENAFRVMADDSEFYIARSYRNSVETFTRSLSLISAVHAPLELDFARYRTRFSLLSRSEVEYDSQPERDPFHSYYVHELIPKLAAADVRMVGISIVFPGQVQPAFSLALLLRRTFPGLHITAGGPAVTQFMARLSGKALEDALSPFNTVVSGEGEFALLELAGRVEAGETPAGLIRGRRDTDLRDLPAPDFDGLPLASYIAPEPVLPYDTARGCYWGKCAFCHYGLAGCGTAPYRERDVETAAEHLMGLSNRYGARLFYLSEDTVSPKFLLRLAGILGKEAPHIRWSTDIRAEPSLTPEACAALASGGALSVSVGIESGNDRVLAFMDKGIRVTNSRKAVRNLAGSGIAAEVMCFTGFPTETYEEAMETLTFLSDLRESISLFMCGEFALTHGSRVAGNPELFDVKELWEVRGDDYRTALFYRMGRQYIGERRRQQLGERLDAVSEAWAFGRYPWAGSLSTAHTQLWYHRLGPDVFRRLAREKTSDRSGNHGLPVKPFPVRYDLSRVEETAADREAEIWETLIHEMKEVTRERYALLSKRYPLLKSRGKPGIYR